MNDENGFENQEIDALEFTRRSRVKLHKVVDSSDFEELDAEKIYQHLMEETRTVPFGDHLKRYIYKNARMSGDYEAIDIKEYQEIIIDSFKENSVRQEHLGVSTKISAMAKNWLNQHSVSREVVYWLGFGLNMPIEDVSNFLMKALREQDINYKNPIEIIYGFCLKNGYKFPKAVQLKESYNYLQSASEDDMIFSENTSRVRKSFQNINNEGILLLHLSKFKTANKECAYSITAQQHFEDLFQQCQRLIAIRYNWIENDNLEMKIGRYKEDVNYSKAMLDDDKGKHERHIKALREQQRKWTASEIDGNDIEKMLCCEMPRKSDGHLVKLSESSLSKLFDNKRMSGEHIKRILEKKIAVDRFDLITLNFLLLSEDESYADSQDRYTAFVESTNKILTECSMAKLYTANPYEWFLMACIHSEGSLETYTSVWTLAFGKSLLQ